MCEHGRKFPPAFFPSHPPSFPRYRSDSAASNLGKSQIRATVLFFSGSTCPGQWYPMVYVFSCGVELCFDVTVFPPLSSSRVTVTAVPTPAAPYIQGTPTTAAWHGASQEAKFVANAHGPQNGADRSCGMQDLVSLSVLIHNRWKASPHWMVTLLNFQKITSEMWFSNIRAISWNRIKIDAFVDAN